jgi:hypothetical protein
MTKDDIIRMAREAGFNWPEIHTTTIEERLERFANLVAKHEREECANLCEQWNASHPNALAAAIRARGNT